MNKVDNYDLSLNLLDKAHQSLAHTIADLELLREGTAFNQILNDGAHIIEPDELTHILDKFAEQHPNWEICIETSQCLISIIEMFFSNLPMFFRALQKDKRTKGQKGQM